MGWPRSWPWITSLVVHAAVLLVFLFLLGTAKTPPPPVQLKLISSGTSGTLGRSSPSVSTQKSWFSAPAHAVSKPIPEPTPEYLANSVSPSSTSISPAAPVSLDELLPPSELDESTAAEASVSSNGWSSSGTSGVRYPPLPPPRLSPLSGVDWTLVIRVPENGGFAASVSGLNSGHPELDQWLLDYLSSVAFPASPSGEAYDLVWNLHLSSGKPR